MTNSRRKGKVGELQARDYLDSLGFGPCKRGQQRSGLEVADGLSSVHIEIKFGYPIEDFDMDRQLFADACMQADRDSRGGTWVVLWKPMRKRQWRLSWNTKQYGIITLADDQSIQRALDALANGP